MENPKNLNTAPGCGISSRRGRRYPGANDFSEWQEEILTKNRCPVLGAPDLAYPFRVARRVT
jgi:hypothetical protein